MGRVQVWVVVVDEVAALATDAAAKVLWVETDLRAACMSLRVALVQLESPLSSSGIHVTATPTVSQLVVARAC